MGRGRISLEYGVLTVARPISSLHKTLRRNVSRLELYIFASGDIRVSFIYIDA